MKISFRDAFLAALKESGRSLLDVATSSGVSYEQLKKFNQGKSGSTNVDDAAALAETFGLTVDQMLNGIVSPQRSRVAGSIAVPGHAGAGDEIFLVDDYAKGDGLYLVERPAQLPPHGVVAVEVQGSSMEPVYSEGDLLFYSRDTAEGVPCEAMNRKVIAETEDGRVWVKQIKAGSEPGLFHLLSLNPTGPNMHDMRVKWAAPVRLHLPKEFVKRVD